MNLKLFSTHKLILKTIKIMNLFWRHKKDGHVVKHTCLTKMPNSVLPNYVETEDQPTHYYDDNSGLLTGILVGEMLSDNSPSINFDNDLPVQSDPYNGMGGGDFGGGGSGGSYDAPDTSSSYDSSPSYDSGSSYDSSSNYDSSSSSSFDSSSN